MEFFEKFMEINLLKLFNSTATILFSFYIFKSVYSFRCLKHRNYQRKCTHGKTYLSIARLYKFELHNLSPENLRKFRIFSWENF